MGDKTEIAWTNATWNPTIGCKRVSAGCDHCYAFQLHDQRHVAWKRGRFDGAPAQYHVPFSTVQLLPERLTLPLSWKQPRRVFVNSMSDLFHEDVPDEFIREVWDVMVRCSHHTFQILTKRPERMRQWVSAYEATWVKYAADFNDCPTEAMRNSPAAQWARKRAVQPTHNIWLGVSVEDQERADERIPLLLQTPAAVRFISAEPLLEEVDLSRWLNLGYQGIWPVHADGTPDFSGTTDGGFRWRIHPVTEIGDWVPGLDWVIAGGESGPRFRPVDRDWLRTMRDQCLQAGVPFFLKQIGGRTPKAGGNTLGGQTWQQFPAEREAVSP